MAKLSIVIPMFSVKHHGGVRIILQFANYLADKGHNITIITPKDKFNPIYPVSEKIKIEFISPVGRNKIFYLKTLVEFIFKISKNDFILANFFPTFYSSLLAQFLNKGKIVYFVQGVGETHFSFKAPFAQILKLTENYSFKFNIPIVITSDWEKNCILSVNKNANFKKIPLGLPEGIFYPDNLLKTKNSEKIILYFPRKETRKGLKDFLKTLEILIEHKNKFTLGLVTKEKEILSEFDYLNNQIKIKFFNPKNDEELRKIYSSAYVLANSSWVEGFYLPALEAMACGTPAVITDCGGVREYAEDNYNCLVVPPKHPELLAYSLEKILKDESLREELAKHALEISDKFKFINFAQEFENYLYNLKFKDNIKSIINI